MNIFTRRKKPVLVPPPPVPLLPRTRVNVVVHDLRPATISKLQELHAWHVRYTLYLAKALSEPEYLALWLEGVRTAQAVDLRVLVVVHQAPPEWQDSATVYVDFARETAKILAQVPGCDIEWFNECETAAEGEKLFNPFSIDEDREACLAHMYDAGLAYGDFLSVAAPLVRPYVNRIVTNGTGIDGLTGYRFLTGLLKTAFPGSFDAVAVHAYGYPATVRYNECYSWVRFNNWNGPIWCTEFGMNDTQYPPDAPQRSFDDIQREELERCYTANPGYSAQFVYCLASNEPDTGFPLVRHDGTARPAFDAISSFNLRLSQ